jgi:hypothetical protein
LGQDFCDTLRKKNVTRVTAVHHPVGQIDTAPRDIQRGIDILATEDGAGMDSHSELEFRNLPQSASNLNCTTDGLDSMTEKGEREAVAGSESDQPIAGLGVREFGRAPHDLVEPAPDPSLLVHGQQAITHDVHE